MICPGIVNRWKSVIANLPISRYLWMGNSLLKYFDIGQMSWYWVKCAISFIPSIAICLRAYILITPESCWVETINKENNRTQSKKNRRGKCCNLVDIIDSPRWVCLYLFEPKRLNNSVRRYPTQHVLPTSTWSRDLGDSIAEWSVLPSDSQSCDPEFEHRQITLLLKSEDEHYGGYNSHQNTDLNLNVSIKVQAKC